MECICYCSDGARYVLLISLVVIAMNNTVEVLYDVCMKYCTAIRNRWVKGTKRLGSVKTVYGRSVDHYGDNRTVNMNT